MNDDANVVLFAAVEHKCNERHRSIMDFNKKRLVTLLPLAPGQHEEEASVFGYGRGGRGRG